MIINGLGGKMFSEQHALKSAEIINQINPKFLSTLTLSFPYGIEHYKKRFFEDFQQQTIVELFKELKLFIQNLNVENVIYRSNHISNNLILEGTLNKDSVKLIQILDQAILSTPENLYPTTSDIL